ncbi:hypothetical protein BKG86_21915 [Mycobacteroides chelonae]|nr:hypothetical protein BKG86_21915 [Mycobacteroides chelonae]
MTGGRHTLPTGSHHQPLSQLNGVVAIAGRQVLATGSHHPSGQLGTMGSAETIGATVQARGISVATAVTIVKRISLLIRITSERGLCMAGKPTRGCMWCAGRSLLMRG